MILRTDGFVVLVFCSANCIYVCQSNCKQPSIRPELKEFKLYIFLKYANLHLYFFWGTKGI